MQIDWQPSCTIAALQLRARVLAHIRAFFAEREVLEVETPILSSTIGTDPNLSFFNTHYDATPLKQRLFLHTSPEFAMKRLLAAGSGSIYQLCKCFRNGEAGRFHNPEFTMLEWYRVGFDLSQLMDEIANLLQTLFLKEQGRTFDVKRQSYQTVFQHYTGLDPLAFDYDVYCAYAVQHGFSEAIALCEHHHALWLDYLFSFVIQPQLTGDSIWLIYGYPACQSSLAKLNSNDARITERVEVFIQCVELGNGYYELQDATEQAARFEQECSYREQQSLPDVMIDKRLLAALKFGLPECSGMAIGVDRLLMLLLGALSIDEVLSFSLPRA